MSTSAIAAALGAYTLFIIVLLILLVVAYWKMFTKAGIAGWKSLIPPLQRLYRLQDCLEGPDRILGLDCRKRCLRPVQGP